MMSLMMMSLVELIIVIAIVVVVARIAIVRRGQSALRTNDLPVRICQNGRCRHHNPAQAMFCGRCGRRLESD